MSHYRIQNPATGHVIDTFETSTDEQIQQALAQADATYRQWRELSIQDRAAVVRRIAELFEERKEDLAKIIAQQRGKPVAEGLEEVEFAASILNCYGVHGPSLAVDQEIPST